MSETVTKETVLKVKRYKNDRKYSSLTLDELALLCGTSSATVSEIIKGEYNHLLTGGVKEEDTTAVIPYETLKHLVACEYVVEAILSNAKLSTGYDGALFVDYKVIYGILRAYLPDDTNRKLEELKREEENYE